VRLARSLGPLNTPATAYQAFAMVLPVVREVDLDARLKRITASENLDAQGRASRWEFFFDLPSRRAKLQCDWLLPWDEQTDDFAHARLEGMVRPFPPTDSVFYVMVAEGKLLHRQIVGLWNQEYQRSPNLPFHFRDSDEVIAELARQGLDISGSDFSLTTEAVHGQPPNWVAQTRSQTWRTRFR
jgi:hypothetical protein